MRTQRETARVAKTQRTILSPSEFAWFQLGEKTLYDWQIECLEAIGLQEFGGPPVAIAAANGSGKTAKVVAAAICWFLSRFPRGQIVVTSGSFRQVEKQLWPALRVHQRKFPGWVFLQTELKTPEGWIRARLFYGRSRSRGGMAPEDRADGGSGDDHRR